MSLDSATRTVAPNRVDARTIRHALKLAGITYPVRITSGRTTTYVAIDFDVVATLSDVEGEPATYDDRPAAEVAAALRPLWNDGDERVSVGMPWSVQIRRAGYYNTVPVAAELAVVAASGVHPGRVVELAEDSTRSEREAELEVAQPADEPLTLVVPFLGNVRVRRAAPLGRNAEGVRMVRARVDLLEALDVDGEWVPLRVKIGREGAGGVVADYVRQLLERLEDRRENRTAAARLEQARSFRSDPVVLAGLERLGRALSVALASDELVDDETTKVAEYAVAMYGEGHDPLDDDALASVRAQIAHDEARGASSYGGRPAPVRVSAELDRDEPATFDTTPATGPDVDDEPEEGFPHPSGFAHLFEVLQLVRERRRPFLELSDAQAEAAAILVERGELRRFLDGSEVWLEVADAATPAEL